MADPAGIISLIAGVAVLARQTYVKCRLLGSLPLLLLLALNVHLQAVTALANMKP